MSGSNTSNTLPGVEELKCPHCEAVIPSVLKAQAVLICCSSCRHSITRDAKKRLTKVHQFDIDITPEIPLYSVGTLHHITYQVVGFMQKRQIGTTFDWREYLLFNPYHGYAVLSEYNGHWNYIQEINDYSRQYPKSEARTFSYQGEEFMLYNKYKATVKYARGEFNSDVLAERETQVYEYIKPPFMLIKENSGDELRWFTGEYITPGDIKQAFQLEKIKSRTGVGATQLFRFGTGMGTMYSFTIVFALVLFVIQLFYQGTARKENVFAQTFTTADTNAQHAIVTRSFELKGGTSAVQLNLAAPLSNDWFDLEFELINHQTGERFEVAKSIEFYSGTDGGEYWSEGRRDDYIILSSVPDGTYHLNLYPQWNVLSANPVSFEIQLQRDVPLWANFFLILLLGCLPALVNFFAHKTFEARRWMESDYSPYRS